MVKKWSEVTASEAYKKLPETKKAAAQEQYFSQVVAPQVPEADVGIAREQFFNYVSGTAPKPNAPTTFQSQVAAPPPPPAAPIAQPISKNVGTAADSYGAMGEYIDDTTNVPMPQKSVMNVMQGKQVAPPASTPVKPEVRAAFQARYDAATPQQRKTMEAQPNWMGDIARSRAAEMAKLDVVKNKAPSLESFDPRVEARRLALIGKGEKPEFAEVAAQEAAETGITPGREVDYMRYKGLAEPRPIDEALASEFEKASMLKRGIEAGRSGIRQQIYGLAQAGAELVGAEGFAKERGLDYADEEKLQNSIGQNPDYWKRATEGAINSIAQQAPMTAFALMSGSVAIPMAGMWVQQFGGSYAESRKMGLDPTEATERSGWMATAEVLGEIPGFGKELKLLRGALKNAPLDSLKQWVINTAKREIPGEQFTLAMQTLGDIKGVTPFGTKEIPSIEQYLEQAKDTLVQTIIQSGIMGGGATVVGKGAQLLTGRKPEQELPSIPSADQLMRDKGFFGAFPPLKKQGVSQPTDTTQAPPADTTQAPPAATTQAPPAAAPTTRIEPTMGELTPEEKSAIRQKNVDDLAMQIVERQGIPAEDAIRIAEGKIRAQEEIETKRQDKLQKEVEGRATLVKPSENRVDELTQDLIGAGMNPVEAAHRATLIAQEEAENDADAEAETKGATNVAGTVPTASGTSVTPSGTGPTGLPTAGATETVTTGLGTTGADVGKPTVRETIQLDPLKNDLRNAEARLEEARKGRNPWEVLKAESDVQLAKSELAKGEQRVAETAKAEQTETQGQEAPVSTATGEPKKRGRPTLAPDLKSISEQKRKQQRTTYKATDKQVTNAERMLAESGEPVDESKIESEEQFREMQDDKRRQRNQAIRELYDVSRVNRGKPGQRAAALLKDPSITQRELAEAEQGHEMRKRAGALSMSKSSKEAIEAAAAEQVADPEMGKVTTGAQALTRILKTGNDFQKTLARRLRSVVGGLKIVVVEANQPLPEQLAKNPRMAAEWDKARALYIENEFSKEKILYVRGASFGRDQGVNNITMLHELFHAATNRKIMLAEQAIQKGQYGDKALIKAYQDLLNTMYNAAQHYEVLRKNGTLPARMQRLSNVSDIFGDPREFVAYGMTDPIMQEFLKGAAGEQTTLVSFFKPFVDALRRLVGIGEDDTNALADLISATDSILSAREVGKPDPFSLQVSPSTKEEGEKKDTTSSFAGESVTVIPGANVRRLATMLGAKLYGAPDKIASVSVKELFQNSFDAIKGALENGQLKDGKIALKFNEKARTITITDNGLGMPASVMGNQFLQIAGTVKETKRASGGLGVAKMLFLFENKKLEVVSLRDGQLARMVTTGDDLKAALDDPSYAPQLVTTRDPAVIAKYKDMFPEGHGTTVVVEIPESYVDASSGEENQIPFDVYDLKSSDVLTQSPLFDNIEVTVDRGYGPDVLDIGAKFPINEYTPFANVNFEWGTARVYISKEEQERMWGQNTHILSNGLWQFNTSINDRPGWDGEKIKRHFYVDVTPKDTVKPEDPGYPFDMNRQNFSITVKDDFQKIFNYITAIYGQMNYSKESKSFGVVQYVNSDGSLTEPKDLTPTTPPTDNAFTLIKPGDEVEVRDGVLYVNNRALPELSAEDLKNTNIRVDELMIPQEDIDPNKVMVHDNTVSTTFSASPELTIEDAQALLPEGWTIEAPNGVYTRFHALGPGSGFDAARTLEALLASLKESGVAVKELTEATPKSLSDYARSKFGERYDKYLAEIGDTFKAIRAALITSSNGEYADLARQAIGVSVDMEYYGVSILLPFKGMFINPAVTSLYENPKQIAVSMIGTMLHELAHFKVRSHNADFASEMQRVINLVETHEGFDLQAAKARLTKHIEANQDIFKFLNKEFRDGNLTASGNRFKDVGGRQAINEGPTGAVGSTGASGEESGQGVSGGLEPSYQTTGQVGIGTGAAGQTTPTGSADEVRTQKEIDREVDIDLEKIKISRQAEELAKGVSALQALRDPRKMLPAFKRLWKGANYAQRIALLKPVTNDFLAYWGGSYIPELKNTYALLQKMGGSAQQLLHSSAILAQTVHKAFQEDSTLQNKLEEVAYASTLAEIDPSNPNADERSPKLDKLYTDLGYRGQQMFTLIKEHYENLSAYFGQLLDDQITNSRISPEAKNTLMAKVRKIYEADKKITPYFPLVRRGDFWLAFGTGKHRKFFTFESMAERDAAAEGFAKERRTSLAELKQDKDFSLGNDLGSMRKASFDSSDLLKGLFDIIDAENLGDPGAKDELKDAVYQLYLTTMPEQSFRRQFISRKNITGFSTDLLRNLSTTGVKMATQLARVKYSPLLRNSISAARDSIAGREELEPFVREMERRVGETLNPPKEGAMGVVANIANRASFIHYLSGASSALLQPLGVFQTGMPILMARYGVVGTTVQLTKMLRVWDQYGIRRTNPDGTQSFVAPSIANATGFTPDEKRAVREMLARDVSQSTYASALFGYKSAATIDYGSVAERGKRAAAMLTAGLLHSTERLSREMLFMASYRLNINAGTTHQQAVDNAVNDTNEALGNYGEYNRPPIMKKGLGKVMLQFTMYPLHVTLFLLRNFKKSLPLLNKEGKWEATKIFYGTLGTTFLLGGAAGLPMFSMVMGLIGWAWRDEDKPQELKDVDYETWWRTVFLPEKLGHITIGGRPLSAVMERGVANGLTGLDISSRTSLNDMWLRDMKETKTARESMVALALEKAGPSANMVLSYADAYEAMVNGDYRKAVEKISPALIRNFVMTHKYATEGAEDNKGAELMVQGTFTSGELLGQAIGFRSDLLANTQRVGFKMAAIDQRVNNERTKTLNNLAREYLVGEKTDKWDGYLKQLDKRDKFNIRYPEKAITEEQIADSLEKRQTQRGEAWAGVTVDEKSMPYTGEAMLNITKEIERREKEMGKRK